MRALIIAVVLAAGLAGALGRDGAGAILFGDVDCNGAVESSDAALLLQFDAGLLPKLPCKFRGDVNTDGRMNSLDASLILQYVAGLIEDLGPPATPIR